MRDASEIDIATVPKNSREEVRIRLSEYHGKPFVDLRIFAEFGDDAQGRKPTKKGLAVSVSRIDDLIAALGRAKSEAVRHGFITENAGTNTVRTEA